MLSVALKGLAGRKIRALLTGLAVIIGVAMISGTYVLTDTISKAFNGIFDTSFKGTDAVVSGKTVVDFANSGPPTLDAALLDRVRSLPDVADATGSVSDETGARLIDKQGKLIDTKGAPAFAYGIDPTKQRFNALQLTTGRFAAGTGEVVIDPKTAADHQFKVGDTIRISGRGPAQPFKITGLATFGGASSLGSATIAAFDIETAQKLVAKVGKLDQISVAASPGVSADELTKEIATVLPDTAQVRSGTAEAKEQKKDIAQGLGFITNFLLAFAGIALFVGAFVIFNTLSITVAQRTREFATLRTLGASRRQVMGSVLVEALIVGLVSSIIGLFAGLGIAKGLNALFVALGIDLPQTGAVLGTRTIVVSLLVGTIVTVVASLVPARRATRVAPISAVREGATPAPTRLARRAPFIGAVTGLAAVGLLGYSVFGSLQTTPRLLLLAFGLVVLFLAVALVLPRLVGPLARIVGAPSARIGGVSGRLGLENAIRNPGRTASTAAALMIGLALMTFVAVLGSGLRQSSTNALEQQITATHVISRGDGFENLTAGTSEAAAKASGVEVASGIRSDSARAAAQDVIANGVDPETFGSVYNFRWDQGSNATLRGLAATDALVSTGFANKHGLSVGGEFPIVSGSGEKARVRVAGTFRPSKFDSLVGDVVVSTTAFDGLFSQPSDALTLLRLGDPAAPTAALDVALRDYPESTVRTAGAFIKKRAESVNTLLNLLYVLLALSVIVSLFGMVNTLALSVIERTRELGMMRAVGMSRRQARGMIRHEGIITALIGAAMGLPLGVGLAALITRALSSYDVAFSVPVVALVVFAVVSILAGILAATAPGRRAARIDVLRALQYE